MHSHKELQKTLKEQLEEFSTKNDCRWETSAEKHIDPPVTPGSRRIDVAVDTNQEYQKGYAIEIKTINSEGYLLLGQLRDALIAGFRPVLVAPDSFFDKTLPHTPDVPLNWATDMLSTSLVTSTDSNPPDFRIVEDRLRVDDDLHPFFQ